MPITIGEASVMNAPLDVAPLHILVVEDYEDAATSMAMLLRMYGHEVQIAKNGEEALEKVQADEPDDVLLDVGLPGMSGYEVARRMTVEHPWKRPLLIAVTGYGREEDRRRSAVAGID